MDRYINDRFLPEKAIDLLDEASACASIKSTELAEYEKLKKELEPLKKEESDILAETDTEKIDYERLASVKTEIAQKEQKIEELEPVVNGIQVTEWDLSNVIK